MTTDSVTRKGLTAHYTRELREANDTQSMLLSAAEVTTYAKALDDFSALLNADEVMKTLQLVFDRKDAAFIRGTTIANSHNLNLTLNKTTHEVALKIMAREGQENSNLTVTMHYHPKGIDKIHIKKRWFKEDWSEVTSSATVSNNRRDRTTVNTAHWRDHEKAFCNPFEGTNSIEFVDQLQTAVKEALS